MGNILLLTVFMIGLYETEYRLSLNNQEEDILTATSHTQTIDTRRTLQKPTNTIMLNRSGYFTSPGYPDNYALDLTTLELDIPSSFRSSPGTKILVIFIDWVLSPGSYFIFDFANIERNERITGRDTRPHVMSIDNYLPIYFFPGGRSFDQREMTPRYFRAVLYAVDRSYPDVWAQFTYHEKIIHDNGEPYSGYITFTPSEDGAYDSLYILPPHDVISHVSLQLVKFHLQKSDASPAPVFIIKNGIFSRNQTLYRFGRNMRNLTIHVISKTGFYIRIRGQFMVADVVRFSYTYIQRGLTNNRIEFPGEYFTCANLDLISRHLKCDNNPNCYDGSDEYKCGQVETTLTPFQAMIIRILIPIMMMLLLSGSVSVIIFVVHRRRQQVEQQTQNIRRHHREHLRVWDDMQQRAEIMLVDRFIQQSETVTEEDVGPPPTYEVAISTPSSVNTATDTHLAPNSPSTFTLPPPYRTTECTPVQSTLLQSNRVTRDMSTIDSIRGTSINGVRRRSSDTDIGLTPSSIHAAADSLLANLSNPYQPPTPARLSRSDGSQHCSTQPSYTQLATHSNTEGAHSNAIDTENIQLENAEARNSPKPKLYRQSGKISQPDGLKTSRASKHLISSSHAEFLHSLYQAGLSEPSTSHMKQSDNSLLSEIIGELGSNSIGQPAASSANQNQEPTTRVIDHESEPTDPTTSVNRPHLNNSGCPISINSIISRHNNRDIIVIDDRPTGDVENQVDDTRTMNVGSPSDVEIIENTHSGSVDK